MLGLSFFTWWYGRGWAQVASSLRRRLHKTAETFSVNSLIRTLFAPWRRIISYPGASLNAHFHAWLDNLFSRIVGFFVRLVVLFTAAVAMLLIIILTAAELVIWPLLPPAAIVSLVKGLLP